jgi:type VI secretion system protein ImpA
MCNHCYRPDGSLKAMPLPDNLLNPIAGDSPCGKNLRYSPLYDKVREARRQEEDLPQGDWSYEIKKADWPLVFKLTTDALANETKDLQLAAWLTEAQLHREHIDGLRQSLDLLQSLMQNFWDHLYPEIEDGDLALRAAPLAWIATRLPEAVRRLPLTKNKLDWFKFQQSRSVGYEADCKDNEARTAARLAAIQEQKCTAEAFDEAARATGNSFYQKLSADLIAAVGSLRALTEFTDEKFGPEAPNFAGLRSALEDLQDAVKHFYRPPTQEQERPQAPESEHDEPVEPRESESPSVAIPKSQGTEPVDRDDAMRRLATMAHFLRRENRRNPVPYLLLRAMRWGELREAGSSLNLSLLEAPPSEKRTELKRSAMEGQWDEVLETAESVLELPCARGWLDLQRYAVRACESLGSDLDAPAAAIRSELKALLMDYPDLLNASLLDDTPAANPETQIWLRESILPPPPPPAEPNVAEMHAGNLSDRENTKTDLEKSTNGDKTNDVIESATKLARAGHVQEAIAILARGLGLERSGRGRFRHQVHLASLFVASKHEAIAYPILLELTEEIERRNLEQWEDPELLVQPVVLLYRCAVKLGRSDAEREKFYQKLCRLDPTQALTLR